MCASLAPLLRHADGTQSNVPIQPGVALTVKLRVSTNSVLPPASVANTSSEYSLGYLHHHFIIILYYHFISRNFISLNNISNILRYLYGVE